MVSRGSDQWGSANVLILVTGPSHTTTTILFLENAHLLLTSSISPSLFPNYFKVKKGLTFHSNSDCWILTLATCLREVCDAWGPGIHLLMWKYFLVKPEGARAPLRGAGVNSTKALNSLKPFFSLGGLQEEDTHGGLYPSCWFRTRMGSVRPWSRIWLGHQSSPGTWNLLRLGTFMPCRIVHSKF